MKYLAMIISPPSCCILVTTSGSPCAVLRPAASTSSEDLEMQILWPHLRPVGFEAGAGRPSVS